MEKWLFSAGNAGSKFEFSCVVYYIKICLMSAYLYSINYDGLDAFLCVECGHCTSGAFNYELTAGLALNAIAVLDEDG